MVAKSASSMKMVLYVSSLHLCAIDSFFGRGTGMRGLMRGMATLPQDNQELLVVRDKVGSNGQNKVGRPPGELG